MGGVDVTSVATIDADQRSVATFAARRAGVVAGLPVAAAVIDAVCGDAASAFDHLVADGDRVEPGTAVARVHAPTRLLLTAERSALNLLCHLSGVATLTRRWVDALAGTATVVRDTRKTTPGLRALEKYAVRVGGGVNHRMGLSDAALVKDNHVAAAGGVAAAFAAVRSLAASIPVEIEVDSLAGLTEALAAGADTVLLDNFTPALMTEAVALRDRLAPGVTLEASGGLSLAVAAEVGATGVDFVAVGELTHSAPVLDLGLDLETATDLSGANQQALFGSCAQASVNPSQVTSEAGVRGRLVDAVDQGGAARRRHRRGRRDRSRCAPAHRTTGERAGPGGVVGGAADRPRRHRAGVAAARRQHRGRRAAARPGGHRHGRPAAAPGAAVERHDLGRPGRPTRRDVRRGVVGATMRFAAGGLVHDHQAGGAPRASPGRVRRCRPGDAAARLAHLRLVRRARHRPRRRIWDRLVRHRTRRVQRRADRHRGR